jgi:hypothetical protein
MIGNNKEADQKRTQSLQGGTEIVRRRKLIWVTGHIGYKFIRIEELSEAYVRGYENGAQAMVTRALRD